MRLRLWIAVLVVFGLVGGLAWAAHRIRQTASSIIAYSENNMESWTQSGQEEKTFQLAGATSLTIENRVGSVEVIPGGTELRVHALRFTRSSSGDTAESAIGIVGSPTDSRGLKVTVPRQADHTRVDMVLQVPSSVGVALVITAGDVKVVHRDGPVRVDGRSGNVTIEDCRGPVDVRTTAGNTEISRVRGKVFVDTGAGEVRVSEVATPIHAHTSVGNVTLDQVAGDEISATSGCGNVDVTMSAPFSGQLTAHTRIGNASVALRAGSRCHVAASAGIGEVHDDVPPEAITRQGPGRVEVTSRIGEAYLTEAR